MFQYTMATYKDLLVAARESQDYTEVNSWLEEYRKTPNPNDPLRVALEVNDSKEAMSIMERVYDPIAEEKSFCYAVWCTGNGP